MVHSQRFGIASYTRVVCLSLRVALGRRFFGYEKAGGNTNPRPYLELWITYTAYTIRSVGRWGSTRGIGTLIRLLLLRRGLGWAGDGIAGLAPPPVAGTAVAVAKAAVAPGNEARLGCLARAGQGRGRQVRVQWLVGRAHGNLDVSRMHRSLSEQGEAANLLAQGAAAVAVAPLSPVSTTILFLRLVTPDRPAFWRRPAAGASVQAIGRDGPVWGGVGRRGATRGTNVDFAPCSRVQMARSRAQDRVKGDDAVAGYQCESPFRVDAVHFTRELLTPSAVPGFRLDRQLPVRASSAGPSFWDVLRRGKGFLPEYVHPLETRRTLGS